MRAALLRKISVGALTCVVSLGMGLTNSAGAQAKTLTIYSGRNEKLIGPLIEKARKDLGLDIKVRYGKTSQLAIALLEEGRNSRVDLFFAQDAGALGAVEQKQRSRAVASVPREPAHQQQRQGSHVRHHRQRGQQRGSGLVF